MQTFTVVVHDVILASACDATSALAAKRASFAALDALEGDPDFMARTCDCRSTTQAKKGQKKAIEQALAGFSDDEDLMAVESILAERDGMDSEDEVN
jgi:endoribonuclease Dicer